MLMKLLGYSKPIPLHDHTDSRRSLRAIEHQKSGDPLGDPTFSTHVDRVTDADERQRKTERILAARRTWAGAAAALLLALLPQPAAAGAGTRVLETALSPDGGYRVEVADFASATDFELYSTPTAPGGVRRRISQPNSQPSWDVSTGIVFVASPTGMRVAYRAGRIADLGQAVLYTTGLYAPTVVQVSQPMNGMVHTVARFGRDRLVYTADVTQAGGALTWWLVGPLGDNRTPTLFADGFESGTTAAWR